MAAYARNDSEHIAGARARIAAGNTGAPPKKHAARVATLTTQVRKENQKVVFLSV